MNNQAGKTVACMIRFEVACSVIERVQWYARSAIAYATSLGAWQGSVALTLDGPLGSKVLGSTRPGHGLTLPT